MKGYDSTRFIKDRICREERQYALFLYLIFYKNIGQENIVNQKINGIINACIFGEEKNEKQKVVIEAAYYEATFMRDYFMDDKIGLLSQFYKKEEWSENQVRNLIKKVSSEKGFEKAFKNSFNYRLLDYCFKLNHDKEFGDILGNLKTKNYLLHNLGNKEIKGISGNASLVDARKMMSSKPDIAIVYRKLDDQQNNYLRLFECKYLSNESDSQREIQDKIANFLCDEVFKENKDNVDNIKITKADEAHKLNRDKNVMNNIIRFVKADEVIVDEKKEEVNIPINKIMELVD